MTDDLSGLFDGTRRPGLHRVEVEVGDAGIDRLAERLRTAGWTTVRTVERFDDLDGFYDNIAAALEFPDYFGRNLDALWDCLTDLTTPTAVIIADWQRFARPHPKRAAAVLSVLEDRTTEPQPQSPPFALLLT